MEQQSAPPDAKGSVPPDDRGDLIGHRWFILLIIVMTGFVYWKAVTFDFVTYDDYELVYQNEAFISNPANIITAFETHAFTTHRTESAYYRPLLLTSYILDYQLWKLAPWGYHLVNLLIHMVASVCVYGVLFLLSRNTLIALACGMMFALHPVQTESVAWVAGRNDLLLGLMVVLSFFFYMLYRRSTGRVVYLICSVIVFVFSLFTKESAVFYVLIFPLYDYCFIVGRNERKSGPRYVIPYGLFGLAVMGYLAARTAAIGSLVGAEKLYGGIPLGKRLTEFPGIFAEHISLLVFPARLSVVHPLNQAFWLSEGWMWGAFAVPMLVLWFLVLAWRKNRLIFFGLAWLVLGLIPALDIFPVAVPILEHRLYLPMVGFAAAVVPAVVVSLTALRSQWFAAATLGFLLVLCGILSTLRLPVWRNSETMWTDAIQKAPTYSRSYFNLAGYYYEHQQYDRTINLMLKYLELNPQDKMGYDKLLQTYMAAGRYSDAARVSRSLIAFHPMDEKGYLETAGLFINADLPDSALAICAAGLADIPGSFLLHDLMGRIYVRLGNDTLAQSQFQAAIKINPTYGQGYFNLGVLSASRGDRSRAIGYIEDGLKYANLPNDLIPLLYRLYLDAKQTEKAKDLRRRYNF